MGIKKIVQKETALSDRPAQIKKILKNILANHKLVAQRIPATDNKIIFCLSDNRITDLGQFHEGSISSYFKTRNPSFKGSYYEIWDRINKTEFTLNRMYFHLYSVEERSINEYILLHTDPKDPDQSHGNYKRSPHLHFKKSCDDLISHAHIALNINDYDVALSSIEEMNKCFLNHIKMLGNQILKI